LSEIFKNKSNRGRIRRLWKEINENILTENDFVYRKEIFKNYESITFRCSQYRRFTECQYQWKSKVYHDGHYQIFYSQHHEHHSLENITLSIEIRSIVRDLPLKVLTISQI